MVNLVDHRGGIRRLPLVGSAPGGELATLADHNVDFVDISCYGADGNTSINVAEENGSGAAVGGGDEIGNDDDVAGKRGKELRGMWKDDINNWTETNVSPWRKSTYR